MMETNLETPNQEIMKNETIKDESVYKKRRHRKKKLYNSILQQMEFYFSDSNLSKDRFLSQLISENPCVDLNVFLKFNKIRQLTLNIEDIQKAIRNSSLIQLSEDGSCVYRSEPLKEKTNVDECTIYVEHLKSDATHEWVTSVFSEFGKVVYVSIPKYKHNNAIKGFAFVEFNTEKEAEIALNYFENIGCKMPSNLEPSELCSISTFEGNVENMQTEVGRKSEKRKLRDSEADENADKNKKIKLESTEPPLKDDGESKNKKKMKKEHKKKNVIKELGLQILAKKEWKQMRNKYLDLQKKKMQEFKKHLYKNRFGQVNYDKYKKHDVKIEQKDVVVENVGKSEFVKGVIVKIDLAEPVTDAKKLKNDLKTSNSGIKFVDIPNPGSSEIYVRFTENTSAEDFSKQESFGKASLLDGTEENDYWNKISEDRAAKAKKTAKKQRGRDKLLKKAKHIKFDE